MEFKNSAEIVEAWMASGKPSAVWARENGIHPITMRGYVTAYNSGHIKTLRKNKSLTTIEKLEQKRKEIEREIENLKSHERINAINTVIDLVSKYKIKASEIYEDKPVVVVPVKYKDAFGNTWSGRGKKPKWLEGKDPSAYLINEYE